MRENEEERKRRKTERPNQRLPFGVDEVSNFFSLSLEPTLIGVYRSSSTKRVLQSSQPLRPAGTGPWSGRAAEEEEVEEEGLADAAASPPPLASSPICFYFFVELERATRWSVLRTAELRREKFSLASARHWREPIERK